MPRCCCRFFFQAEDGIRDADVTGVQTCALPICDHRDEDRGARAGPAEEGGGGGDDQAEDEDQAEGREDPARHAPVRYSGRQRRSRRSTCLIPSAITMPITPSVRRATIMSAAFSVPSDWMMR